MKNILPPTLTTKPIIATEQLEAVRQYLLENGITATVRQNLHTLGWLHARRAAKSAASRQWLHISHQNCPSVITQDTQNPTILHIYDSSGTNYVGRGQHKATIDLAEPNSLDQILAWLTRLTK